MRRFGFVLAAAVVVALCGCNEDKVTWGGQSAVQMNRKMMMKLDYLLYLPKEYGTVEKDWPLIVFLHGIGERGDDINKVKMHGPPKLIEEGREFEFIVVSPQCPGTAWWTNCNEKVMALIDDVCEKYNVDQSRIYLTGLSMGGYGTWSVACTYPERFAAIAPICGGGLPITAQSLKDVPVWAFHGAKDPVVPLSQSEGMVEAVKKVGGDARLTVYPEAEHDSWTVTYENDELYKWFLEHTK